MSQSELLAERVRAAVELAEERWRNHERAHEALASALSDYKLAANEWRTTVADIRSSNVTRPEYTAEHKALTERVMALAERMDIADDAGEARGNAVHTALSERISGIENTIRVEAAERAAIRGLFGQTRNLVLLGFTVLGGVIAVLVYLRV